MLLTDLRKSLPSYRHIYVMATVSKSHRHYVKVDIDEVHSLLDMTEDDMEAGLARDEEMTVTIDENNDLWIG